MAEPRLTFTESIAVTVVYLGGVVLTFGIASFLSGLTPGIESWVTAGVIEPVFSKFVPAVMLVSLFTRHRPLARITLNNQALRIGSAGGLIFGAVEFLGKIQMGSNVLFAVSSGLHVLYGGIIGNAVFRFESDRNRWWHDPVRATIIVMLTHTIWNNILAIYYASLIRTLIG